MTQPLKWRETIDPFILPLKEYTLIRVLGYPHAGNDVFYTEGKHKGELIRAYIKVERQKGADIHNEVAILNRLRYGLKPPLIEYDLTSPAFIITKEVEGERLSVLLSANPELHSRDYMKSYGAALAELHAADICCERVKHRNFFDKPGYEDLLSNGLTAAAEYLYEHHPAGYSECFVHGDFHYANILWAGSKITCVLDYELSGHGIREYDMAWAVVLRPGQGFLNTKEELSLFLNGYGKINGFSLSAFCYYYIQIASRFYAMGDDAYKTRLKAIMDEIMRMDDVISTKR